MLIHPLLRLFLTGFIQVFLIAGNTYFISKVYYLGALIFGFLISYVWVYIVQKAGKANNLERIIYSLGTACGSVAGLFFSSTLLKLY